MGVLARLARRQLLPSPPLRDQADSVTHRPRPMSALHLAVVFALIAVADRLAMPLITLRFQASLRIMSIMGNLVRCNITRLTH